ncbi:MAG: hypothetical protein C4551_03535 [Bacillota bacterium]|nr:MAG: hypothetical protein C4551_03535 [Bacillota bacterium]
MALELTFFASPIARPEEVALMTAWVREQLGEVAGDSSGGGRGLPVAVVLTGGTEDQVLRRLEDVSGPATLLALPHSNSIPACMEILAKLGQDHRTGRIVVVSRGQWRDDLDKVARAADLTTRLRKSRIGLFGGPSSWLVASSPDPAVVTEVWGPEVVSVPLSEVVGRYRSLEVDEETRALARELLAGAAEVVEPDWDTVSRAVLLYRVLRDMARELRLDALTVRCFDLLGDVANTGCFALSRLNDDGVVAGCEGDLPATLTMLVLAGLSGRPCFMANPSDVDAEAGMVTFGHCSAPLGIVNTYRLRSHFESGLGVGLEGHFRQGETFTVARVGGRRLDDYEVFEGHAMSEDAHPTREDLCRTQVTLDVGERQAGSLLERPLGNHHVLVPGALAMEFIRVAGAVRRKAWAAAMGGPKPGSLR